MSCPSENTIVGLASGVLKGERRRAVEDHLDHCPECASQAGEAARHHDSDGEFSEVITSIEGAVEAIEVPRPTTLPAGTMLGRYIVIDLLATGGLGQVYTAYDPDLDRKVAIKLLRPLANHAVPDAHAQRWLLREAQAMAKLSHPNVVPIHDVGTHAASVFIAMELVDGQTFSGWRRAGGHSWREVRDLLLSAGEGLIAAHDAGLVHRDFKPANILVGHDGRVRVVDFGLARAVAGPAQDRNAVAPQQVARPRLLEEPLTEPGTVVGTPPFMPAEQFQDDNVGPWSDQFAFCAAMFLGLYGTRPFPDRDLTRLRTAILNGKVTPPSSDNKVPPWLHRAVLKGLDPNPQRRHQSMRTLLHALVQDRRSRKRQWAVLSLVAVLSASTAGVATAMLQPVPSEQDKATIEAIFAQAREAAQRAHFIYPPVSDVAAPTAYRAVLELDAMAGPAAELASIAATDLRREFAASLVALGDAYWEKDGGSAFAADYYGAAVIFGADEAQVLARALRTPAQLADLERRARNREFSSAELSTAALLAVLADPDTASRRRRASVLVEGDDGPPATVRAQLQAMLGTAK
ncbi:MAG: protein kinase, partial [Nannocystaceae bacterium]|nr:protein kinase [Nannocystaceae bacterium]